jgi:hypothetical protein
MKDINIGDVLMFSTNKGDVKIGSVIAYNDRITENAYEDIVIVETEDGNVYHVDLSHLIQKIE